MNRNPKYKKYKIGRYTYGKPLVLDWNENSTLKIGSFCSISGNVTILLGGNHRPDWVTTYPFNKIFKEFKHIKGHPNTKGDVIIGNDVWIGYGATILSGITIGDGAVIGPDTVVTKSVQPYSIVVGSPGRVIRKRFDDSTIKKLLQIKWWDWDIGKIKRNIPLMLDKDIDNFIKKNSRKR
jgi:acetyltransferase-like isoleucine patch superfamily enzyme